MAEAGVEWIQVRAKGASGALAWRRQRWSAWPAATPPALRAATAHVATWVFGGVTATFLAFHGDVVARFPEFLQRLLLVR